MNTYIYEKTLRYRVKGKEPSKEIKDEISNTVAKILMNHGYEKVETWGLEYDFNFNPIYRTYQNNLER